jgi:biopolymer transport protein ExbB
MVNSGFERRAKLFPAWAVASLLLFLNAVPLLAQTPALVAAPANPVTDAPTTLWGVLVSGGFFMIPLAGMLFLGVLLVFIYLLTLRRGAVVSDRFLDACETLLRKRDFRELLAISNRRGESVARIVQEMLSFAKDNPGAGIESIREIAETEGIRQASSLSHRITYLADVGTIAPMVGLLGTVSGMIHSFAALSTDIATSKPMMLAHGVSEALVCTASGLVVGIFAFSFYAYFRGRVQRLTSDLEAASTQILAMFALYYGTRADGSVRRREREREPVALEDDFA